MCEWRGPVGSTCWRNIHVIWVSIALVFFIPGGIAGLCYSVVWIVLVLILAYTIYYFNLSNVSDYDFSRWDMERNLVCHRTDTAIGSGGVNIVHYYEEPLAVFPLPPLDIVVSSGRKRTTVFAGPVNGNNRERVEALEALVGAALGKNG